MRARDKFIAPFFVLMLVFSSFVIWTLSGGQLDSQHLRWRLDPRFANGITASLGLSWPLVLNAILVLASIGGLVVCLRSVRDREIVRLKAEIKDLENAHNEAMMKSQREATLAKNERALKETAERDLQASLDESARLLKELSAKERLLGLLSVQGSESPTSLALAQQRLTALQELREGDARRLRERDDEAQSLRQEIARLQAQTGAAMAAQQEERNVLEQRSEAQVAALQARIDEQSSLIETRDARRAAIESQLADQDRVQQQLEEVEVALAEMTREKMARGEAKTFDDQRQEALQRELQKLRADLSARDEALREKDVALVDLKKQRREFPRAGGTGNQLLQAELVQKTRLLEARDKALRELEDEMKEQRGEVKESDTGKRNPIAKKTDKEKLDDG